MKVTTDKAMIFSSVLLVIFTIAMIVLFVLYQCVPDTLIASFFVAFGFESGCCAFIHRTKSIKNRDKDIDIQAIEE